MAVHPLLLPDRISWTSKGWPCGCCLKSILMVKFPFPTISFKCAMSVVVLPAGMLEGCNRLRPLPLSLVGWCASCNDNTKDHNS